MDIKGVLHKCLDSVYGSALPYVETGDAEERALATVVTRGGVVSKYLSGKALNCRVTVS